MGIVNVLFVLLLTDACELKSDSKGEEMYSQVPQEEQPRVDDDNDETTEPPRLNGSAQAGDIEAASPPPTPHPPSPSEPQKWTSRIAAGFSNVMSQISKKTLHTMYKLWFLLLIDSLADGMVPYSLTNYYMDIKFHPSKSTLGDVTSLSYFLGAIGAVFAGPLARKIGLINTMVFTHVPSSAAVLFFPLAPYFWMTAVFLLIRTGLNNMDQAPRSAFIAAVVKPEERTAIMGITAMLRSLAAMCGPTVTGLLAEGDRFGVAFIAAGICRLVYDFGLYAMFVGYERGKRLQDRNDDDDDDTLREEVMTRNGYVRGGGGMGLDDEDMELHSLASESSETLDGKASDSSNGDREKQGFKTITTTTATALNGTGTTLQIPTTGEGLERVRSRSPHRSTEVLD